MTDMNLEASHTEMTQMTSQLLHDVAFISSTAETLLTSKSHEIFNLNLPWDLIAAGSHEIQSPLVATELSNFLLLDHEISYLWHTSTIAIAGWKSWDEPEIL